MNPKDSRNLLIVVDMQNDFIDGALGSAQACAILDKAEEKIRTFPGTVLFTRDTHGEDYLNTQEGRQLPVPHCIRGTYGWQIHSRLDALRVTKPIDKNTFGSIDLAKLLQDQHLREPIESITLIGLCTDICVISNALLLKACLPEVPILVDASCCAGVTVQSHEAALVAMNSCQIQILS